MATFVFYLGRAGQVLGMFMLLEDIVMAGPMGPQPWPFAEGVAVFLAGWALTRLLGRSS